MFHTHYDNLKVARNAPQEVIRAAYKTLSQKHHPDRNPGNTESERIMAIINASYDVLSDPEKRRGHDKWIMEMEAANQVKPQTVQVSQAANQQTAIDLPGIFPRFVLSIYNLVKAVVIWAFTYAISIGVVIGLFWIIGSAVDYFGDKKYPPPGPKPYQADTALTKQEYVRPAKTPNGKIWPTSAGYISGYKRLHTNGLSTVTVDNSQNDSDVFVKLISLDGAKAYPVRQFFIPAFGSFTLNKVTAGQYDIRYRDLGSGGLSRSEAFNLEESQTYDGVQYSNITMTLYKVRNGNMQTYGLSEAEF